MASVSLYQDNNLKRKVAIKEVTGIHNLRRTVAEIRALEQTRSDHVIEIYDVIRGDTPDEVGIVVDYVEGQTLADFIANKYRSGKRISKREFLSIIHQVAIGLKDIHAARLAHRDLKPANMLLDKRKRLRIIDFGISKEITTAGTTLGFVGTPRYAPPEIIPSVPTASVMVTRAVDIYALGAIAWYVAIGEDYVVEPGWPNVQRRFAQLNIGISSRLCAMLDKCLSVEPKDRPAAANVERALRNELLTNKHQATLLTARGARILNIDEPSVTLVFDEKTTVTIDYTGDSFQVREVAGTILCNNRAVNAGENIPGSCVFYSPKRDGFIPFDQSNPEVAY